MASMSVCIALPEYMKLSRFQVRDKAETLSINMSVHTNRMNGTNIEKFGFFYKRPQNGVRCKDNAKPHISRIPPMGKVQI